MRYTFIGFLFFISSVQVARSQKMTELEKAFMNTSDSTLVLTGQNPGGLWVRNAFIVSKKDSLISCYLYHFNVYDLPSSQRIPKGMADYLKAKDTYNQYSNDIEVNRFFHILEIGKDSTENLWQNISAIKPWEMEDDSTYGVGCPVEVKRKVNGDTITEKVPSLGIIDGGTYVLKLITKNGLKKLTYYLPEESEKLCPGKEGRQKLILLKRVMLKYFGKDSVFYIK
ncbi:hypothetical protein [Olivibacter jilunii]|uniref:hypothetical protein n=1 Tax=Olivibacter jilunii TaxID=985016 RepID=UPI003F1619A3